MTHQINQNDSSSSLIKTLSESNQNLIKQKQDIKNKIIEIISLCDKVDKISTIKNKLKELI